MQIQLAIFDPITSALLADWSTRVTSCHVRTSVHGYESCEAELQVPFLEAFLYYQQLGPLKVRVSWGGYRVWEGRLEDPTQFADTAVGLKITVFGGWVAFNDAPYTALWSDTKTDGWHPLTTFDNVDTFSERYQFDNSNRLFIAPQKNANYVNTTVFGAQGYAIPDQSTRQIIGVNFDFEFIMPVNWEVALQRRDSTWGFLANIWTKAATGALQSGSVNLTLTACDRLSFRVFYNAAAALFAGETGSAYLKVTNIRVVTATANRIDTTFTANRVAGVNVTATVVSTARMFVGQRLTVSNALGTIAESVIVLSIGSATQFNATFINGYVIGEIIRAHVIYPDEIIEDCVSHLNAFNPTQVSSDTSQIQSQAIDLDQAIYEDQYPTEIINQLIAKSDDQTPPRQWVAMVYNNQTLIVRPRGTGLAWYADITSLQVVRTLTQLYNSVYGVYKDTANKRNLRTAVNTNVDSVDKFRITRRKAITVDTTSATQATKVRDSILALQLDPIPRATIKLDRIFDKFGNAFPLFFIRADDTLTLRNLPPILGATLYDKIRTLVITRTDVDLMQGSISLELEIPMPDINVQLVQALKGN